MFPAEPLPDTIGSYKVVRRLPSTGVGERFLAKSQGPMGFARECELKLMPDTSEGDVSFAEQLAREAAICARMNHPAVVRVFDFFEHDDKLVLALEHVEGNTLSDVLANLYPKNQRLGDASVYYIGARIAGALADAHAAKDEQGNATPIVHRNLSPDAVLLAVDGEVRLTGFGVGKILGRTPDTAFGRVKGTPGYMAPEQARGEPVTTKADVYGLGLLLWSLLAGRRPPADGTWPRRIGGVRTDLPKEVVAIVDAALDHFPGTRKITAREMEQWLSKAAPAAKGKAELRDRVAALRAEVKDADPPPPPSSRRRIAAASPYKGVSFGAPAAGAPPAPAAKVAPVKPAPTRTATVTGVGTPSPQASSGSGAFALHLPPVPPAEPAPAARPGPQPVRFGPAPDLTPVPPPVAPTSAPNEDATVPQLTPHRPRAPMPTTPGLAPMAIAPVLPLAPPPAPPSATPAPAAVRFGPPPPEVSPAAPPAASAPAAIRFGPPPADVTPPPVMTPMQPAARPAPAPGPSAASLLAQAAAAQAAAAPPPPQRISIPHPPPPRPPLPSILTIGPGRRTLSTFGTIVVSAFTATVVVAAGLYMFIHRDRGPAGGAVSASAAPAAPPSASAPPAAAPAPSGSASAGANPADLPLGYGYLTVESPANANVYVSGRLAGPVNKPLKVRCGRWFIRLAAPQEGRYPEWVSPGETVVVACQETTRLEAGSRRP